MLNEEQEFSLPGDDELDYEMSNHHHLHHSNVHTPLKSRPLDFEQSRPTATNEPLDDLDTILELNEEKSLSVTDVPTYNFEICDILLNVAPCGHSIVGESVGDYGEFESTTTPHNSLHIDLVTSSGHTKNGAVSVLQRSIRPEVIATFQIPDVVDMWSVLNDSDSHTFLFLSKIDSTMVLQMANEITELDKDTCVFCTKQPTLCCANLSGNKYIVQVTTNSVHVYVECSAESSGKLVVSLDLTGELDAKMKHVAVGDPYVVVLTEKGAILVVKFDASTKTLRLVDTRKCAESEACLNNVCCFTLFKDENEIFNYQSNSRGNSSQGMDFEYK